MEGGGMPVAIDTAGNVDKSVLRAESVSKKSTASASTWMDFTMAISSATRVLTSLRQSDIRMVTSGSCSTTPIPICSRKRFA